jgi:hypothetical protein
MMIMGAQAERVFPIFIGVWVVLGIVSTAFFFLNDNAALKRKVHPPYVIGVSILFFGFVVLMGTPRDVFFYCILVPAIVLITFMNLRNTKFCDTCGRTLINQNPFVCPRFCSKCGASLEDRTD